MCVLIIIVRLQQMYILQTILTEKTNGEGLSILVVLIVTNTFIEVYTRQHSLHLHNKSKLCITYIYKILSKRVITHNLIF